MLLYLEQAAAQSGRLITIKVRACPLWEYYTQSRRLSDLITNVSDIIKEYTLGADFSLHPLITPHSTFTFS
jgi:hypothetical protein